MAYREVSAPSLLLDSSVRLVEDAEEMLSRDWLLKEVSKLLEMILLRKFSSRKAEPFRAMSCLRLLVLLLLLYSSCLIPLAKTEVHRFY